MTFTLGNCTELVQHCEKHRSGGSVIVSGFRNSILVVQAWSPRIAEVSLESSKLSRPVHFAQISDIHIGSRRPGYLDKVIDRVNELDAEFLCVTGDLVDQSGITEEQLKGAPQHEETSWYDRDWETRIHSHYGAPVYW